MPRRKRWYDRGLDGMGGIDAHMHGSITLPQCRCSPSRRLVNQIEFQQGRAFTRTMTSCTHEVQEVTLRANEFSSFAFIYTFFPSKPGPQVLAVPCAVATALDIMSHLRRDTNTALAFDAIMLIDG
jgi:hypothetical protein